MIIISSYSFQAFRQRLHIVSSRERLATTETTRALLLMKQQVFASADSIFGLNIFVSQLNYFSFEYFHCFKVIISTRIIRMWLSDQRKLVPSMFPKRRHKDIPEWIMNTICNAMSAVLNRSPPSPIWWWLKIRSWSRQLILVVHLFCVTMWKGEYPPTCMWLCFLKVDNVVTYNTHGVHGGAMSVNCDLCYNASVLNSRFVNGSASDIRALSAMRFHDAHHVYVDNVVVTGAWYNTSVTFMPSRLQN